MNALLLTEDTAFQRKILSALGTGKTVRIATHNSVEGIISAFQKDRSVSILLIDFLLKDLGGLKSVAEMSRLSARCKTVLFSPNASAEIGRQALNFGVSACLPRDISHENLKQVFELLEDQHNVILCAQTDARFPTTRQQILSKRELQILALLCDGQQNKEIAHTFGIQEVTVKMHMRAIIRKLGAQNRTHAAMIACRNGLI